MPVADLMKRQTRLDPKRKVPPETVMDPRQLSTIRVFDFQPTKDAAPIRYAYQRDKLLPPAVKTAIKNLRIQTTCFAICIKWLNEPEVSF